MDFNFKDAEKMLQAALEQQINAFLNKKGVSEFLARGVDISFNLKEDGNFSLKVKDKSGDFNVEVDGSIFQEEEQNQNQKADDDPPTEIDIAGNKYWTNSKGQPHREGDLPAIIYADGTKFWYKNGQLHREGDLPAVIYASGGQVWCENGLKHRNNDKPAIINANGGRFWYKNGLLHRDGNKPAVITKTQYEYWVDGNHVMTIKHENGVIEA